MSIIGENSFIMNIDQLYIIMISILRYVLIISDPHSPFKQIQTTIKWQLC